MPRRKGHSRGSHLQEAAGGARPFSEACCPLCYLQLAMGKMMEQGPVLIITFQAQLVMVIRNSKGEVVEGDPVSGGVLGEGAQPPKTLSDHPAQMPAWNQESL